MVKLLFNTDIHITATVTPEIVMLQLTICHPPHNPWSLTVEPETTGFDLKTRLTARISIADSGCSDEMRLVCAGRVIQDHLSLECQGVTDKSKIYVSIKKSSTSTSSPSVSNRANGTNSPLSANSKSDPIMGPLLKLLADNPEFYQQMILSNPQMQKLIEKNPELGHALSDPATLKSMLNAATNPRAYNEMLRGHDRAMSNLENIPEGFSHLKRIYSTLQEPMYDALTPKSNISDYSSSISNSSRDLKMSLTSEPIPNPWAPPSPSQAQTPSSQSRRHSPVFGFKSHSQKRKLPSTEDHEVLAGSMQTMRLQSPLPLDPLPSRFRSELEVMHKLGYDQDEEENIPALIATDGHVSSAIDRILRKRLSEEEETEKK